MISYKKLKYKYRSKCGFTEKSRGINVYYDKFCDDYYFFGMEGVPKGTRILHRTKNNALYNYRHFKKVDSI